MVGPSNYRFQLQFVVLRETISRGRKQVFRVTLGLVLAFTLGCALSPNIVALCIFRFLVGFFGAPTVTNAGGSVTDLWPPSHRSVPLAIFTAGSFIPPVLAPVVGGFIVEYASSSWSAMQWTWWSNLIFGGVVYVLIIFLPETYGPKLLRDKARRMASSSSPSSGHGTLVSSVPSSPSLTEYLIENLTRPWMMLCTEPIVFLFSLYMAFVFGILYLDFTAYPIVYHDTRGWSPGIAGLSFLGMALGMTIATILSPYVNTIHAYYVLKLGEKQQQQQSSPNNTNRSSATPPEARLPHLIILSWFIPLSLFWFGWTAAPPAHYLASIASGVPFGIGLIALFLGINSYLTDCYGPFAASALAATAVFRAAFGAVFPLFAQKLYAALGVHWAMTLLGALAVLLAPLPWAFYRFGPAIRRRSAYHVKTFE